ncbi:hypothetical protein V3W47_19150 [Deinococcus sp. YIM 134068]|uniref:hypothetical protein n=1 Tax=Deinococcus lichenicola TaxID=3118910 RepID=UPI002F92D7F8
MALFGDLEHHALADLAKVLHARTGTLFLHEAYERRTLELTLREGRLQAMYMDGFPLREVAQVRDILSHLQARGRGAFEFQQRDGADARTAFYDLPLRELVQVSSQGSVAQDVLPHPDTRFRLTGLTQAVPPSLTGVWTLLRPHLIAGASATQLAERVGRPQQDVLFMLHALRAAELIAPQRAAGESEAATPVPAATLPAPAPLLGRLLGALRRLTGVVSA